MPLLEITTSRKVTATVSLEEPTANLVNQYAAFTRVAADDVVNKALEYVFTKDKDFQKFIGSPNRYIRCVSNGMATIGRRESRDASQQRQCRVQHQYR
jgi:hypothetical protein